jgi:hypothetical protein
MLILTNATRLCRWMLPEVEAVFSCGHFLVVNGTSDTLASRHIVANRAVGGAVEVAVAAAVAVVVTLGVTVGVSLGVGVGVGLGVDVDVGVDVELCTLKGSDICGLCIPQ